MDNELYIEIPSVSKQQSQTIDTDTRIVELMKQGCMTFSYFQILYENGEHNCPGALFRHWMAINCLDCQNQTATCWIKERMNDKSFVEYLHAHLKRPYFACEKGRLFDSLSERLNSELSKMGVHVKCKQRGVQNER